MAGVGWGGHVIWGWLHDFLCCGVEVDGWVGVGMRKSSSGIKTEMSWYIFIGRISILPKVSPVR